MARLGPEGERRGRRWFLGVASASAVLAPLVGCAPRSATNAPPTSLRVALPASLPLAARSWLTTALREESAVLGVEVEIAVVESAALIRQFTSLDGPPEPLPDLALTATAGPARLGWGTTLAEVDDLAERLVRQNGAIATRLRQCLTSEKKLWAVPFGGTARLWLLRRDLADAGGVGAPNTFAEAVAAAGKLNDAARGTVGLALPLARSVECESLVAQVVAAFGGGLATSDGLQPALVSAEAAEALSFLADLVRRPERAGLPLDRAAWSGAAVDAAFFAGRAALALVSADAYVASRADPHGLANDANLRSISPPAGSKRRATVPDGYAFVVARECARPDLVASLLRQVLSPARLRELAVATGGAFVPAYADATHQPFWDSDPILAGIIQAVRGDASRQIDVVEPGHPGPITAGAVEVGASLALSAALGRCSDEGLSAEDSLKLAQTGALHAYDRVTRDLAALRRRRGEG